MVLVVKPETVDEGYEKSISELSSAGPPKSFREHAKTKYNTIECSYDNNNNIIYIIQHFRAAAFI